ncbi:energy transducer TonB, partial [Mucilaginibacter sp.]|uniref:energy transducer TonB n=1 Tax=Mucilaginibacter sp. TaxID=1882438 RepID=UPI0026332842
AQAAIKPAIDSAKYALKVTNVKTNISVINDIMLVTDAKTGLQKIYRAKTLTDIDKAELLQNGMKVEIVTGVQADSMKKLLPPPPPPSISKESFRDLSRFISIKTVYPKAAFAKKIQGGFIIGINIDGNGLISNVKFLANPGIHNAGFDEALLSAVNAYHGQIKEKAGMYKMGINFLIPGENQVNFPTPSTAKDANYVGETTILGLTDTGKKRLPPPPPAPPKPKVDQIKFPPPVVKPDKPAKKVKDQIKFPPPVVKPDKPANAQVNNMPPPPSPPFETIYEDLIKYVLKHARYPAIARDNNVNGHILLSLVINKDHKVTDVKVEKGIGYRCDEEAARALSTYTNTINKAPGKYKMVVTFMLVNNDNTKFYAPKPLGDDDLNVHNFIGEAVITGSIK